MNNKIAATQVTQGTQQTTQPVQTGTTPLSGTKPAQDATATPATPAVQTGTPSLTGPAGATASDPFGTAAKEASLTSQAHARVTQINTQLEQTKALTNSATQNLISSIQSTFNANLQELQQSNAALLGSKKVAGYREGRAQYAPELQQGILTDEVQAGTMRVSALQGQMLQQIATAQQAQADNNWKAFNESYALVENTQKDLESEVATLHQNVMDAQTMQIQQQQEARAQDTFNMTKAATLSESAAPTLAIAVARLGQEDQLAYIQQAAEDMHIDPATLSGAVEKQLRQNHLDQLDEQNVLSSIRSRQIGDQVSQGQLKIAQQKLKDDEDAAKNSGMDPANLVAYAQQYAATGQIPTGLPTGTFGLVSSTAAALPKPVGTIVDISTGVKPSGMSATTETGITAAYDLTNKLDQAKGLFDSIHTGVIAGSIGAILPSTERQGYNSLRAEVVDLLARARTGAVISPSEEATYLAKLPGNFNKSLFLGADGDIQINSLKSSIGGKLNAALKNSGVKIVGYGEDGQGTTKAAQFDE